jgi:hypothetical protein
MTYVDDKWIFSVHTHTHTHEGEKSIEYEANVVQVRCHNDKSSRHW